MRFHLFPFRTEKLSSLTPMVLRFSRGRVGSRLFKVRSKGLTFFCVRMAGAWGAAAELRVVRGPVGAEFAMCSGSGAPGPYGLQGISAAVAEFVTRSGSRLFGQHGAWGACCGDGAGGGAGVSPCGGWRCRGCAKRLERIAVPAYARWFGRMGGRLCRRVHRMTGCELLLLKSGRIACRYASEPLPLRRPSGAKKACRRAALKKRGFAPAGRWGGAIPRSRSAGFQIRGLRAMRSTSDRM